MAPKELPDDWQLECAEVRQRNAQLLQAACWSDVTFAVGAAHAPVPAHRLLLAAASPVFERMFYGALAEKPGPIDVPDMEPEGFEAMLEYIYTDSATLTSSSLACDVYYGALKYMLPRLQEQCVTYLCNNLDPEGACSAYELALMTDNETLRQESMKMMRHKTTEVLEANTLVEARPETLAVLFSLEPLHMESELQLLAAAERYARAQGKGMIEELSIEHVQADTSDEACSNVGPSGGDADTRVTEPQGKCSHKGSKQRASLRDAVRQIRFLTVDPEELTSHPSAHTLLTDSELRVLADSRPPPGFSTCTIPRVERQQQVVVPLGMSGFCVFYSPVYRVRNVAWKLMVQRNLLYRSLCVYMEGHWEYDPERFCVGEFEIKLVSHTEPNTKSVWKSPYQPLRKKTCYEPGCFHFLTWDELLDPHNGYIRDHAFTLEVKLVR